jgi:uncharacterized protein
MGELLAMVVLLAAVGGFAGVLAGFLGVGGGIVLVPAFFYVFEHLGYGGPKLMQVAIGTSLATIVVTSIRSVLGHRAKGALDGTILRAWAPYAAAGAVAGVLVAAQLSSRHLQALFGSLALVAALYLGFGRPAWRLGPAPPEGGLRAGLGIALGFVSALMGIGGGTFGVPLMTLYNVAIHRAVAVAAGFGLAIALPAAAGFLLVPVAAAPPYSLGAVNLPAFLVVIAMTLLTTPFGVRLAHRTDPAPLRRAFAIFLALVAANMLRKALFA